MKEKVEYQLMLDGLSAADVEKFVPPGVEMWAEASHAQLVSVPTRSAALAMRAAIKAAHPTEEIRIYAQPLVRNTDPEFPGCDRGPEWVLGDVADFLDEGAGNCVLDADGIFVARSGPLAVVN